MSNMHSFGTQRFAYIDEKKKLDNHSEEGIFLGYDRKSPAYFIYFPNKNKIKKAPCVRFTEQVISEPKCDDDVAGIAGELKEDEEQEQRKERNVEEKEKSEMMVV